MPNMNLTIHTLEEFECEHCGQVTTNHNTVVDYWGSTEDWCDECASDEEVCGRCGRHATDTEEVWYRNPNNHYMWETASWCRICVDEATYQCEDCGSYYKAGDIDEVYVNGSGWCHICEDCLDSNYTQCADCGEYVHDDDVYYGRDEEPYCSCCIGRHRHSENLHCYHQTDGSYFWQDDFDYRCSWRMDMADFARLYLGIELEIVAGDDDPDGVADDIIDELGDNRFECKRDCSLGDEGVEIVSQPGTPYWHLFSGVWDDVIEIARNHDGISHDAECCGLHIHISTRFFDCGTRDSDKRSERRNDAAYALDRFFHRFIDQLIRFSRRHDFEYCHLNRDYEIDSIKDTKRRKQRWHQKKVDSDRYVAVNTWNRNTIEIRLWRGTLNRTTLRATIEMTAGMAYLANVMSAEAIEEINWATFKSLVRYQLVLHGLPHDDLDAYLRIRGL